MPFVPKWKKPNNRILFRNQIEPVSRVLYPAPEPVLFYLLLSSRSVRDDRHCIFRDRAYISIFCTFFKLCSCFHPEGCDLQTDRLQSLQSPYPHGLLLCVPISVQSQETFCQLCPGQPFGHAATWICAVGVSQLTSPTSVDPALNASF